MREVQVPHTPSPVCTRPPPPPHPSQEHNCTCARISRASIHSGAGCAGFWAQRGQCVRRAPRPPGGDSVVKDTVSENGIYGQEGTGLSQGKRNRL